MAVVSYDAFDCDYFVSPFNGFDDGLGSVLAEPDLGFAQAGGAGAGSAVLSFDRASRVAPDRAGECDAWMDDAMGRAQDQAGLDAAGWFGVVNRAACGGEPGSEARFGVVCPSTSSVDGRASQKRSYTGASELQATPKKQCGINRKSNKAKTPPTTPPKDPQSLAAKNRRERISERLRTLQELVPNGTKVDMVTMLEKAISYVKFLQLQVKVLATDEFWPAQGEKAPEISQVKEALNAILSSQATH